MIFQTPLASGWKYSGVAEGLAKDITQRGRKKIQPQIGGKQYGFVGYTNCCIAKNYTLTFIRDK